MKICQNCGAEVSDTAKFCRKCGSKLEADAPQAPAEEASVTEDAALADEIAAAETTAAEQAAQSEDIAAATNEESRQPFGMGAGSAEFIGEDYQWGPPTGGENYNEPAMPAVFIGDSQEQEQEEEPSSYTYRIEAPSYDHTDEFEPKDISDNKVTAMAAYLLGPLGIIIALLAGQSSPYAEFHMRQGLKFVVVEALLAIIAVLLCWTIIVPAAAAIVMAILGVIKIISFISVCRGKAVEPAIIRSLGFLK